MALPVLHGTGAGQRPHRIYRSRELCTRHDQVEQPGVVPAAARAVAGGRRRGRGRRARAARAAAATRPRAGRGQHAHGPPHRAQGPDDRAEETEATHWVIELNFGLPSEFANEPTAVNDMPITIIW